MLFINRSGLRWQGSITIRYRMRSSLMLVTSSVRSGKPQDVARPHFIPQPPKTFQRRWSG